MNIKHEFQKKFLELESQYKEGLLLKEELTYKNPDICPLRNDHNTFWGILPEWIQLDIIQYFEHNGEKLRFIHNRTRERMKKEAGLKYWLENNKIVNPEKR